MRETSFYLLALILLLYALHGEVQPSPKISEPNYCPAFAFLRLIGLMKAHQHPNIMICDGLKTPFVTMYSN